jgi:hypothetical protein
MKKRRWRRRNRLLVDETLNIGRRTCNLSDYLYIHTWRESIDGWVDWFLCCGG